MNPGSGFDELFPMALEAWVAVWDTGNDIARRSAIVPFIDWWAERPRDVISALAWVRAKSRNRRRREAVRDLLDNLSRRRCPVKRAG